MNGIILVRKRLTSHCTRYECLYKFMFATQVFILMLMSTIKLAVMCGMNYHEINLNIHRLLLVPVL